MVPLRGLWIFKSVGRVNSVGWQNSFLCTIKIYHLWNWYNWYFWFFWNLTVKYTSFPTFNALFSWLSCLSSLYPFIFFILCHACPAYYFWWDLFFFGWGKSHCFYLNSQTRLHFTYMSDNLWSRSLTINSFKMFILFYWTKVTLVIIWTFFDCR